MPRRRISVENAQRIVDLDDGTLYKYEIAKIMGISTSTVSRVLRQIDTYISEEISWETDKAIGLRCDDCGVLFEHPNGYRCVCDHCRRFRAYKKLEPKRLSHISEIEVDLSEY